MEFCIVFLLMIFSIKPAKWTIQSPGAATLARRCRRHCERATVCAGIGHFVTAITVAAQCNALRSRRLSPSTGRLRCSRSNSETATAPAAVSSGASTVHINGLPEDCRQDRPAASCEARLARSVRRRQSKYVRDCVLLCAAVASGHCAAGSEHRPRCTPERCPVSACSRARAVPCPVDLCSAAARRLPSRS